MIIPPSTGITCPVTIFASSEASQTAVPAAAGPARDAPPTDVQRASVVR